jgi:beta-glucosidase
MRDDVALMRDLGLQAYRFSVAWPRVRPDAGAVNPQGLDFYQRLVDELLGAGITPWVTLYHWDLPQTLEDAGGWAARDTSYRFAEYADTVHAALSDRVPYWTTLNEPWCSALLGYANGHHAPGRTEPDAAVAAVHHLLLAHGLATQAIRARDADATVGITLNFSPIYPHDPASAVDDEAQQRVDGLLNRLFADPVLRGAYSPDVAATLEQFGLSRHVRDGDLTVIGQPLDLLGVNYYAPSTVSGGHEPDFAPSPWVGAADVRFHDTGLPKTAMDWEVSADSFRDLLLRLSKHYPDTPVFVTENGSAYDDEVRDGRVTDPERVAYLTSHVAAVGEAINAGADVRGYFAWSLFDNFEWAYGYTKRFGLVYVDYATQQRIPKASSTRYREIIAANGAALGVHSPR